MSWNTKYEIAKRKNLTNQETVAKNEEHVEKLGQEFAEVTNVWTAFARCSAVAWNGPVLSFVDLAWNARSCKLPHHVICRLIVKWPDPLKRRILWYDDREMTPIVSFAASCHLPYPLICRSTVKCQSTEKRQIPWNVASFDLAFQSMESEDGAFQRMERFSVDWQSQSICKSEDAA